MIRNDSRFMGHPGPEWEESMHKLMEGRFYFLRRYRFSWLTK